MCINYCYFKMIFITGVIVSTQCVRRACATFFAWPSSQAVFFSFHMNILNILNIRNHNIPASRLSSYYSTNINQTHLSPPYEELKQIFKHLHNKICNGSHRNFKEINNAKILCRGISHFIAITPKNIDPFCLCTHSQFKHSKTEIRFPESSDCIQKQTRLIKIANELRKDRRRR